MKTAVSEGNHAGFGPYALKELEIASAGVRPNTRYGILMDKSKIEIVY